MARSKYKWSDDKDPEGGTVSKAPLVPGYHYLRVSKVLRRGSVSGGDGFKDRNGPTMMVIFEDDVGREGTSFFGCYEKLGWKTQRLASCAGVDLSEWEASGYEPEHFADESFANARLVGLATWARVYENEYKGRTRIEIEPVKSEDLPPDVDTTKAVNAPTQQAQQREPQPIKEEEIPF
jgi:hypothetical protein